MVTIKPLTKSQITLLSEGTEIWLKRYNAAPIRDRITIGAHGIRWAAELGLRLDDSSMGLIVWPAKLEITQAMLSL